MSEYWQALRSFSPSLRHFLTSLAAMAMVGFGMMAVLQNLFLLRLGFDARFIGLMIGVGQLVWAAAALPGGMLSNRIGLRNGFMLGGGVFGVGITLLLLVENRPEVQWRLWLLGSQAVINLGVALISVNIAPYLMVVTGERERRYAFASVGALIPATAFLGSVVAGLLPGLLASRLGMTLDQPAPYRLALWVGPFVVWLGTLLLVKANPAHIAGQDVQQTQVARAPLRLLAFLGLVTFLGAVGEGAVRNFFTIYLDRGLHVTPAAIGTVMGLAQLLPIGVALSVPLLVARWGTGYTLVGGILGIAVFLVPLAAIPQVAVAALAYMGVIASIPVMGTARDIFGQELVAPRWRTSSQAVAMVGMSLSWAAVGVVGGALIETVGFGALFFASAGAALLGATLQFGYLRTARRRTQREPPPVVPAAP